MGKNKSFLCASFVYTDFVGCSMGAGASIEDSPDGSNKGNAGRVVHNPSHVHRPRRNISRTSSRGRSGSWKELVRNGSLKNTESRKLRAAALGSS